MARRVDMTDGANGSKVSPTGQVRECTRYRGELARHRVMTADGLDYVVATLDERHLGRGVSTSAYPVARGYLVMMRQPLCVLASQSDAEAHAQHELLVRVLAEAGTGVVRARRRSAAWRRAERSVRAEKSERAPSRGRVADDLDLHDLAANTRPASGAAVPA